MSVNVGINGINGVSEYPRGTMSTEDKRGQNSTEKEVVSKAAESGAVYEHSAQSAQKATYSVSKMSKEDRAALVQQLQEESERQQSQLISLVQKTLSGQVGAFGKANDNSIWRTLASGNFTVDAATKAQAQKDISEDGYWGVKQTSQRLFDFASALAGDDVEKMKKMQDAMEKGFKQAEKTWGGSLPSICKETMDSTKKMFEEYYKSMEA